MVGSVGSTGSTGVGPGGGSSGGVRSTNSEIGLSFVVDGPSPTLITLYEILSSGGFLSTYPLSFGLSLLMIRPFRSMSVRSHES